MSAGLVVLVGGALAYAFWPRPALVDMAVTEKSPMTVTINEEAKTRVRDAYVVSAPIAGRLLRVDVEPGDPVNGDETVIVRMLPLNPSALDVRTREQARAAVSAAEAALRLSRADLNKAMADKDLADLDFERAEKLFGKGNISQAAMDRAKRVWRTATASLDTSKAAISMREADLERARARLISFSDTSTEITSKPTAENAISLKAPVSGRILRVMQKSETTVAAGDPILEIGNIENDLEIIVELLSTDAVKVREGQKVLVEKWGEPTPLHGVVERIEPWGYTKYSALGVEEQRVKAIIQFTDPLEKRASLGHGFRVETRIIVWQSDTALNIPASALFRDQGNWVVFKVDENNKATQQLVEINHNNGLRAQITKGLNEGEKVILYPGPEIEDGTAVKARNAN
ncbi:HlyD family efflux transporter periplasmic adaptor subunit [Sneathiella sp. P13V-1]|nr:HlyD family efflux transporter periplasmic adaptor subunit [Sneathiella sp. P13V-1]